MAYEILSTRQVGQRIRRGKLPTNLPISANGQWRCSKHPKRRLGFTEMLQWERGSRACEASCPPSEIVVHSLKIIVDLAR